MDQDTHYMKQALELAREGLGRVAPNPSVGCVIVKNGEVVGAARTGDGGRPHAEFLALEEAESEAAEGATAYVTLEPCAHEGETPSCARLLKEAGVARVVVACADPDPRTAGQNSGDFEFGVLEDEARALNQGFFLKVQENRPLVTLKIATSSDGKIAAAPGERTQITESAAQEHLHRIRAEYDAVLVGIETALADDPLLTARLLDVDHSIIRCVLDTNLRLPLDSQLVQSAVDHPLYILHNSDQTIEAPGVTLLRVDTQDVKAVLAQLAEQGVTRLLVEGGAKVHKSFCEAGMYDRFLHYQAPHEVGPQGVSYEMPDLSGFDLVETVQLDDDVLKVYERCSQD